MIQEVKPRVPVKSSEDPKRALMTNRAEQAAANRERQQAARKAYEKKIILDLKRKDAQIQAFQKQKVANRGAVFLKSMKSASKAQERVYVGQKEALDARIKTLLCVIEKDFRSGQQLAIKRAQGKHDRKEIRLQKLRAMDKRLVERMDRQDKLSEEEAEETSKNARKRRKVCDQALKSNPKKKEAIQAEDKRIEQLARKYFNIWRAKVQKIVKAREAMSEGHPTVWEGTKNRMKDLVANLHKIAEYTGTKFDAIVYELLQTDMSPQRPSYGSTQSDGTELRYSLTRA